MEEWKPVVRYEGLYEVSNLGNVRAVEKLRRGRSRSGREFVYIRKAGPLKKILKSIGYEQVGLGKRGVMRCELVHRLVAEAFLPNPLNKPQVNHKNGVKHDNRLENLEWATSSENGLHAYRVLGVVPQQLGKFGEHHSTSKAVIQKTLDGKTVKRWGAAMDAVRTGFDSSSITRCCQGKYKSHKGYVWEYAA